MITFLTIWCVLLTAVVTGMSFKLMRLLDTMHMVSMLLDLHLSTRPEIRKPDITRKPTA